MDILPLEFHQETSKNQMLENIEKEI